MEHGLAIDFGGPMASQAPGNLGIWFPRFGLRLNSRPWNRPMSTPFQTIELLRIVDRFAGQFDDLPEMIPGRDDYRMLLTSGVLVRALNVVGQLDPTARLSWSRSTSISAGTERVMCRPEG